MATNKYYYYDHETCTFVEVRPKKTRLYVQAAGVFVLAILMSGVLMWGVDRATGTPEELALQAENAALQEQLSSVQVQMEEFSVALHELAETDQSLYRTLLEAEPISEDVRQVGVGGSDPFEEFNGYSDDATALLRSTAEKLGELERQISLQNTSYRELASLAAARSVYLAQMPAILPADGPVVSGYGLRRHPILRVKKMHHGIDIPVDKGSAVVSTGDGVVKRTGRSPSYGIFVEVQHPKTGYSTFYAHLSKVLPGIEKGRSVKRGEKIALSGNTGRSSGPHLHYEVRDADSKTVNPIYFFAPSMTPQQYKKLFNDAQKAGTSLD